MLERLIARLERARLELGDEDIADAIWLALQMGPVESPKATKPESQPNPQTVIVEEKEPPKKTQESSAALSAFAADSVDHSPDDTTMPEEGLPFQAPAAVALQNALELGRSLRPLMRKVASQRQAELDEEATVHRIVEEEIWQPVLQPAPERWLDLELVVEESPQSFIWRQTVDEFQHKVLERQGAFRNVRTWTLRDGGPGRIHLVPRKPGEAAARPHNPQELMHPSGRQLVLLVSDCQSDLWRRSQPREPGEDSQTPNDLHGWLKRWSSTGPTALVQLLPEWLWDRSELRPGFAAQLSAFEPGAPNPQLVVEELSRRQRRKADLPNALILPVVTLDAEPLFQWAQVVAGAGLARTPGRVFNLSLLAQYQAAAPAPANSLTAEALVERFLATASPDAQSLAGYMAAAPVSLPVVHLIQAKLMRHPTPVQVAEVYMSGLLEPVGASQATEQPIYEFKDGVRKLLNRAIATSATETVLNALSVAIAEKLGLAGSIDSFAAFLSPNPEWLEQDRTVARFAEILPEVLRNLGGHFAALAEYAQARPRPRGDLDPEPPPPVETEFEMPPLEEFEYPVAVVELRRRGDPEEKSQGFASTTARIEIQGGAPIVGRIQTLFGALFNRGSQTTGAGGKTFKIIKSEQRSPGFNQDLGDGVQLGMVEIPGGEFMMGSPKGEDGYGDERPRHLVTVSPFFMGRFPVTQAQWRVVAGWGRVERDLEPEPSRFKGEDLSAEDRGRLPVESVSWYDAVEFCQRLSHRTGREYRLPTEAEWEYACRAGTETPFHFGETILTELANYNGNETYGDAPKGENRAKTTPVGFFEVANAFGLYDMHGNVLEWSLDHWHENYEKAPKDGSAWLTENDNADRVWRGGSWNDFPEDCRSAFRLYFSPDNQYDNLGFRLVCAAPRTLLET